MKHFKHINPSRIAQIILVALAILVAVIMSSCKEEQPKPQYISIDGTVHSSQMVKTEYDKMLVVLFTGRMNIALAKDSITRFERDSAIIRYTHSITMFNIKQETDGR